MSICQNLTTDCQSSLNSRHYVSAVARGVRIALERWLDRSDWAKEISYAALLLECSCHRRDERRLRELRDLHGHVWRMRFEPEGRVESLAKLPRF